jgi:DNA polymerase III alpha subunit (gram-positive type)
MIRRKVDLHLHSVYSDGGDTPSQIVEKAKAKGLWTIALTDHDNIEGSKEIVKLNDKPGQDHFIKVLSDLSQFPENTIRELMAEHKSEEVPVVERTEDQYTYSVTITEHQTLQVTLENGDGGWQVRSWQTVAHMEEKDSTLPVWQGMEG